MMNVMSGVPYVLKAHKDNDQNKTNGVTAIDLALIQSHILGKNRLNSPYKIMAADVTGDGKLTAIDLVFMKRLILGIDTTFTNSKTGEKRLWTFTNTNNVITDSINPFPFSDSSIIANIDQTVYSISVLGIKLGDVNWDWNPALAKLPNPVFIKPKNMTPTYRN